LGRIARLGNTFAFMLDVPGADRGWEDTMMTTTTMRMRHWCLGVGFVLAGVVFGSAPPVSAEMPRAVLYGIPPAAVVETTEPVTEAADAEAPVVEAQPQPIMLAVSDASLM